MIINQSNLDNIYVALNAIFNETFQGAASFYNRVAMTVTSKGRGNDYKFMLQFPMLREWIGDRQVRNLAAAHFQIENKDYEATVELDRNDMEDDTIGIYNPVISELGRAAKQHPDLLIATLLANGHTTPCYDGKNFFATDHPGGPEGTQSNYGGGSSTAWYLLDTSRSIRPFIFQQRTLPNLVSLDRPGNSHVFMRRKFRFGVDYRGAAGYGLWQLAYASHDTLNDTNYEAARRAMQTLKNDEGVPLGIMPSLLVVPPCLESNAKELLNGDYLGVTGEGTKTNIWKGTAEVLVVPWLT
ncbi:Mu-like prophage major head subunit gpT family protein [Desulfobacca acetoxidans]|uniref:Mu-like major head subunit gpT, prophage protein n=1 Tax=Desulfobacca acetoxidans (strain ATCC 700848 / DSM 11109 / ASRB2) TaxID=880072 RepID=F2NFB8_DESAR|nr:Mu-like prophage major head subunit gpT family protein [Desulfobacca acetoxidans]AEB10037.1 Mu-like major head subunit gpT, prophage protein [Desulfobacca acetoxidans DSM 11109]